MYIEVSDNWARLDDTWLRFFGFCGLLGILSRCLSFNWFWGFSWGLGSFSLGGRLWHWHSWDVFSINEVDSVSVDDTRVVVLRLYFEIVGYQVDGALRNERVVRSVRLLTESTATATATTPTTITSSAIWRALTLIIIVSSSRVLATTATVMLLLLLLLELAVATATRIHPLAIVRLLVPGMLLVTAHMGLVWMPRLRLSRMMETTFIVLLEVSVLLLLMLSLLLILLVVWTLHCLVWIVFLGSNVVGIYGWSSWRESEWVRQSEQLCSLDKNIILAMKNNNY